MIMAAKLAPTLLAGRTVIMKTSPETPLESIIAECVEEDGLRPGVVNLAPWLRKPLDYVVCNPAVVSADQREHGLQLTPRRGSCRQLGDLQAVPVRQWREGRRGEDLVAE